MWVILILCVIILLIAYEIQFRWKYRTLSRFPGPTNFPFVGIILQVLDHEKIMSNLSSLNKTYGGIVKCPIMQQMILLVTDLEMTEFFLRSPKFTAKSYNYFYLRQWLGNGILIAEGEKWHKMRKLVTPAFHFRILEDQMTIFNQQCDILIDILKCRANEEIHDIYPTISHFTLDIITETAMGLKLNVQKNTQREFLEASHTMTKIIAERTLSLWKCFDFLYQFSSDYSKEQKAVKVLNETAIKVIKNRRELLLKQSRNHDSSTDKKKPNIFLDIVLNSTADCQSLTDEQIRAEVQTFIFGGHDTTASTISIMMYELANNKEVQDKIVKELKTIYGDNTDRNITMQDLTEMKYMDLVIKEVLRFYTIVPFISRQLREDTNYKGTVIPKDTIIIIFLHGIHKSRDIYENPEIFDPERFSSGINNRHFSFIPFSAGPRNCIGQKYAIHEIKVTFAKLLRRYELCSAGSDYEMKLKPEMVMKPINGIYIRLKDRKF